MRKTKSADLHRGRRTNQLQIEVRSAAGNPEARSGSDVVSGNRHVAPPFKELSRGGLYPPRPPQCKHNHLAFPGGRAIRPSLHRSAGSGVGELVVYFATSSVYVPPISPHFNPSLRDSVIA